ncbi:Eco57I restriction-modification methylase domain-containing protein [Eisenibacter elegans]|uniref:Eco57I restriction-modification methylase domain-containing protein n=1 Tax=Eisenibacter elegans TaxID=997 RepID=UPI00042746BC|nr:DUF559 domain-containing protein [Eisenibacter elegans]
MNLNIFNTTNLFEAATHLFRQLNIKLNSNTAEPLPVKDLLKQHYKDNDTFKAIDKTYFIGIIDDSIFQQTGLFDNTYSYEQAIDQGDKNYNGLMLFALELKKQPTRTEISELTRTFNRISQRMPVALVLKYTVDKEAVISIAISERFKYLQNWRQGEKAGKVIMLRDIHTQNTHAGHARILLDLVKPAGVTNYVELHKRWLEVLDVSILNKKFFQDLSNWYFAAMNEVSFPDDLEKKKEVRNATNLIRLITRVIFIWFIKEKQLVPASLFRKEFVASILKDFNKNKKSQNYYNAILQNLFFGTLNQKMEERKFAKEGDIRTNKEEYGVKNLFRYADLFTIPEKEVLALFKDVPFLNGGLFDCLDKPNDEGKIEYVDGFSRNPKKQATVPDYIFFGEEKEVDLNEVYGTKNKRYSSRGLINLLESYKFTVAENTPIEEEIALDPELLGKVFENLLASYNPETQTTARKQTGSFYTPREIVNYMVDESLLEYLKKNLKSSPPFQAGVPEGGGGLIKNQVPEGGGGLNKNQVPEGGGGLNKNQVPEGGGGSKSSSPDLGEVSEGRRGLNNLPHLKTFRKELRNNLTPAEAKLWTLLKGKQLGRKFRRQFSVANYILDFYCPSENLAIELDGQGHFEATQAEYDAERDLFLLHTGIKVLRFENKLVWDNPDGLLEEIKKNFGWKAKNPSVLRTAPLEGEQLLETRLRDLLSYSENPNPFNETETKDLIEAINNCKILDPACGSGAFPMGILHKMVHILQKLDPENKFWKDLQRKKAIEETEEAFKIGDKEERAKRLEEINDVFENNASDYGRKLYLIENCIYGIDIQPIAVQIAKLRFFISLVIDQKVDKIKENFGIRSLPNLETKFVAANTLISLDKPQQTLLRNPDIEVKENELKELRHKYFTANTRKEKIALQKQDKKLRLEIAKMLESDGWETQVAKQIVAFDPYDQNTFANWFDPEWMFGLQPINTSAGVFDIVIGNPPYVDSETMTRDNPEFREILKFKFASAEGNWDLFVVFTEMGINLTKNQGTLAFIIPNKIVSAKYTYSLRGLICKLSPRELIDYSNVDVFKEADVYPVVILISNQKPDNYKVSTKVMEGLERVKTLNLVDSNQFVSDIFWDKYFFSPEILNLIIKITKHKKLITLFPNILGAATVNEAYQIKEVLRELNKEKNFFKFVNTGTIDPYKTLWGVKQTQYIKGQYHQPILTKEDLDNINPTRTKQSNSSKIIIAGMSLRIEAYFDENGKYCAGKSTTIILGETDSLKSLSGILNSKLVSYWFSKYFNSLSMAGGYFNIGNNEIGLIPIPEINFPISSLNKLVDKIVFIKENDPIADTSILEEQIDELVYQLYDLTEEEIRIVEGG